MRPVMIQVRECKRLLPLFLFFVLYTLGFLLWVQTFFYTLPFLLGLLLAVLIHPLIRFCDTRLHWNHTLSTMLIVAVTVILAFSLLTIVTILGIKEVAAFLVQLSERGFSEFSPPVTRFFEEISSLFQKMNMQFLTDHKEELLSLLQSSLNFISAFLFAILGVITSVPTAVTMFIVMLFSTFFIARDLEKLQGWLGKVLTETTLFHIKSAAKNSSSSGRKYFFSYLFLYFITFCESFIILSVLGVPYPLTLSLVAAVADVLPVLGPGFVFLPLAVYQLLIGSYATALGVVIGWLIVTCVRQVVEPRLVSGMAKIHPLSMLAAIYFSLVGKSIWILLYVMGFFMLYAAFRETGALPSFTQSNEKPAEEPG